MSADLRVHLPPHLRGRRRGRGAPVEGRAVLRPRATPTTRLRHREGPRPRRPERRRQGARHAHRQGQLGRPGRRPLPADHERARRPRPSSSRRRSRCWSRRIIAMEVPLVDAVDPAFYEAVEDGDHVVVDAVAGTIVLRKKSAAGGRPETMAGARLRVEIPYGVLVASPPRCPRTGSSSAASWRSCRRSRTSRRRCSPGSMRPSARRRCASWPRAAARWSSWSRTPRGTPRSTASSPSCSTISTGPASATTTSRSSRRPGRTAS